MYNKEMVEKILESIVWVNNTLGVWAFIIPIIFAIAVLFQLYRSYKKPSKANSRILMGIYAIIYIYSGYAIYIGKDFMGDDALIGGIALWVVALFLVLDVVFNWTDIKLSDNKAIRYTSLFFIFSGIFLYPLIEIATGFTFPRMVFFSAECPTTISLIGVFIGSIPKVNKPLFVLVSLNAIFTGISVAIYGATFDYLYGLAGVFGIIFILIYFKSIFLSKKTTNER
jgi:hypothetical protein